MNLPVSRGCWWKPSPSFKGWTCWITGGQKLAGYFDDMLRFQRVDVFSLGGCHSKRIPVKNNSLQNWVGKRTCRLENTPFYKGPNGGEVVGFFVGNSSFQRCFGPWPRPTTLVATFHPESCGKWTHFDYSLYMKRVASTTNFTHHWVLFTHPGVLINYSWP